MTINIEGQLLETILDTLAAATKALYRAREREKTATELAENRRLLNEAEAWNTFGGMQIHSCITVKMVYPTTSVVEMSGTLREI